MYKPAIIGTSFSVTLPMRLIPPITTRPAITARTMPVTSGGISNPNMGVNAVSRDVAIEFTCVILPMPKEANMQKIAKATAKNFPSRLQPFFLLRPFSR